jgi:hypothetical protein
MICCTIHTENIVQINTEKGRKDATNLSIAVKLLSIALAEGGAKWELCGPMYVQVGPQFLPESILEVQKM